MIRNSQIDADLDAGSQQSSDIWLWALAALALAATAAAAWQGSSLGWPAFMLLCGVSVVSILAVITLLFSKAARQDDGEGQPAGSALLASSFDALPSACLILQDGMPVTANKAYIDLARTLGVEASADAPPSIDSLFHQKGKTGSAAMFRLHHTTGGNDVSEETISTYGADGSVHTLNIRVQALPGGQLWQIIVDGEGDTHADAQLLTEAPIGLFSVSEDGDILQMNDVLRGWLGVDPHEDLSHIKEFIENPAGLLGSDKTPGRILRSDTRIITRKDVVSPSVMMAVWQKMDSGDIYASAALYGHSGLGQGARTRKDSGPDNELASLSSAGLQVDLVMNAPFAVVKLDSTDLVTSRISGVNQALLTMMGQEELIGRRFKSLFEDSVASRKILSDGVDDMTGAVNLHLSGAGTKPVDVYFSCPDMTGCVAYIIDVSMRRDIEDQLFQSQKMQSIGLLAGGVAHDFNNLLTAIRLNTDELLGRHPVGDPSYPELQQINQTVSRSAGLVRKLLAFSSKQTLRAVVLDVTDTLSDLSVMLKQVMVERVKLDVVHGRGLPAIMADRTQLDSVLMNLCVNARDAMVEKGGGGAITLRSLKAKPEDYEKDGIDNKDGKKFVIIEVADTGTGMDAATQKKIFEPFFTTKEQGKGTGLGLATVYGIVQQSGGHLRVNSALGKGTTFRVYIPAASKEAIEAAPKVPVEKAPIKPSDLAGQGRILFVEDEHAVRKIAAKTLRKRGYTVIEAADGEEAYEILEEGEEKFDLMISDVVMPGMDGPTLLKKGRALLGDARIVFISGYAEEEFSELLAEEPDVTFIPKPFTLAQLATKVKEVIGEAAPDTDT